MSYAKSSKEWKETAPRYNPISKDEGYEYMHISASPRMPSTFWRKKGTSRWYLNKKAAKEQGDNYAVPEKYAIKKSFWVQNGKTILLWVVLTAVIVCGFWAFKSGTLTYHSGRFWK